MQTTVHKLDSFEYRITPFPARESIRVQAAMGKVLGPVLGGFFGLLEGDQDAKSILNQKIDLTKLAGCFQHLGAINPDELVSLATTLVKYTTVNDGETVNNPLSDGNYFDEHFRARTDRLYKLLAKIIEVEYGSFFQFMATIKPL